MHINGVLWQRYLIAYLCFFTVLLVVLNYIHKLIIDLSALMINFNCRRYKPMFTCTVGCFW